MQHIFKGENFRLLSHFQVRCNAGQLVTNRLDYILMLSALLVIIEKIFPLFPVLRVSFSPGKRTGHSLSIDLLTLQLNQPLRRGANESP